MTALFLGSVGVLAAVGCSPAPPAHRALPMVVPFKMDKAGHAARIDFSVVEGQANLKRRFMVGLDFPQTRDDSIERVLRQTDVPVHVEVYAVDPGGTTPIRTQDDDAIMATARGSNAKSDSALANIHLHAHDGETSYALVAGFHLSHYGHYVAVVRTVRDQPMFKGIKTRLKVGEFYNTGE